MHGVTWKSYWEQLLKLVMNLLTSSVQQMVKVERHFGTDFKFEGPLSLAGMMAVSCSDQCQRPQ